MSVGMGTLERTSVRQVVLAIPQLNAGGTEGQLVQLAIGLRNRGIDVAVATLFEEGVHRQALVDAGIEVHYARFPELRRDRAAAWRLGPAFARYVRWLRVKRPQVVQMFLYHAYAITVPAARLAGVPVVVGGRRSLSAFKNGRPLAIAWEQVVNTMTTHFVANCQAVADDVARSERLPLEKISVVPNGVSPEFFAAHAALPIESELPLVACVANLRNCKGHRDLLEAMTLLDKKGLKFTLLLAGEGRLEAELSDLVSRRGLDVRFLGSIRNVPALLAGVDLVVLPSHEEGLSNSLLEAMAGAKAIVATSVGGTPEALGTCGILVPPRQPVVLAEAIRRLIEDRGLAEKLGAEARVRAMRLFRIESVVDRYINLYDGLVS